MPEAPDPLDDLAIGYVLPAEEQTAAIWDRAIIAIDANVLLNVYRYSPEARDDLLSALEAMGDRLFIPHQAAREYFHRRIGVLTEQLTAKDRMRAAIDKAIDDFVTAVTTTHRSLGRRDAPEEVTSNIHDKLTAIRDEFLAAEGERLSDTEPRSDEIHDRLVGIVRGRVGLPYDSERVGRIEAEMAVRFPAKIPPGYMDAEKDDGGIGDLLVWNQLLDKATETRRPVVLVTDDIKEDWVWTARGRTIGPRPELVCELHARAGVEFLLYTTARFLTFVAENEKAEISPAVVEEAKAQEQAGQEALRQRAIASADTDDFVDNVMRALAHDPAQMRRYELSHVANVDGSERSALLGAAVLPKAEGTCLCIVSTPNGNTHAAAQPITGALLKFRFPADFPTAAGLAPQLGEHRVTWHAHLSAPLGARSIEARDIFTLKEPDSA